MTQPQLGQRVRAARLASGLTIETLAQRSGLSKSFISMLENGRTNISATRLQTLAAVFGLRVTDFLPDESTRALAQVVRRAEGIRLEGFAEGVSAALLTHDLNLNQHRRIQPVRLTLEPGKSHSNRAGHAGEEFIYVLSGSIRLVIAECEPVDLVAGDSAYYPSALSHAYETIGEVPAVLLTISTPHSWHRG